MPKTRTNNFLFDQLVANADPDSSFLTTLDGDLMPYGQLYAETARAANALTALGVRAGDRVAVQLEKSPQAIVIYLATIRAGAVFLPLNTAYTATEVAYFIGDAEPALFIFDPRREKALTEVARKNSARFETLDANGRGSWPERIRDQLSLFDNRRRDGGDLAAILYTSGTTGRSKGAMLSHANLASNARVLADYWQFQRDDILLHALPVFHTHGLFVAINTVMVAGAGMLFLPRFDVDQVVAQLPAVTCMMGVPTFYTRLLECKTFGKSTARNVRLFTSGSAPLAAETHRQFEARCGHVILERYGMTETNMNTSNPYRGNRVAGTVGLPLPGVEVRIRDPKTREPLADGETGSIEVRGENVFQGYWRMPEKTAGELREDGFFITGDLGHFDASGYLTIVGRDKDLIISGGYNIYPKEVELEIDAIEGVVESAVIGVAHPDFGEVGVGVVVVEKGVSIDEPAIAAVLADKLARFKLPKRFYFVDALPRNAMGKVQKNELRENYSTTFADKV